MVKSMDFYEQVLVEATEVNLCQHPLEAYANQMRIFDTVIEDNDGVYFEILAEPQEPGLMEVPSIFIRPDEMDTVPSCGAKKQQSMPSSAVFNARFEEFKKSKDTYKNLLEKAISTRMQLMKELKGKNYKILLAKRKTKPNKSAVESP